MPQEQQNSNTRRYSMLIYGEVIEKGYCKLCNAPNALTARTRSIPTTTPRLGHGPGCPKLFTQVHSARDRYALKTG